MQRGISSLEYSPHSMKGRVPATLPVDWWSTHLILIIKILPHCPIFWSTTEGTALMYLRPTYNSRIKCMLQDAEIESMLKTTHFCIQVNSQVVNFKCINFHPLQMCTKFHFREGRKYHWLLDYPISIIQSLPALDCPQANLLRRL